MEIKREMMQRKCSGATGGHRSLRQLGPVGRTAFLKPARCSGFAKPTVMQGAPMPTRKRSRPRRKEKWNEPQCGGRARRFHTPAIPVKCPVSCSVASRTSYAYSRLILNQIRPRSDIVSTLQLQLMARAISRCHVCLPPLIIHAIPNSDTNT